MEELWFLHIMLCAIIKKDRFIKEQQVKELLSSLGLDTPLKKFKNLVIYCFNLDIIMGSNCFNPKVIMQMFRLLLKIFLIIIF